MKVLTILAYLSIFLTSCSKNMLVDYEPNVDFESYLGYSWNRIEAIQTNPFPNHSEVDRAIKNQIRKSLSKEGIKEVLEKEAVFFIDYHLYIEEQPYQLSYCPTGFYSGSQEYSSMLLIGPSCEVNEKNVIYDSGTLIIDIVNKDSGQLVWRGTSIQSIDNPRFAADLLAKRAKKVLRGFQKTINKRI